MPWPVIISGTVFWGTLTFAGTSYYLAISRPVPDVDPSTIDLNAVYNATAKDFDSGMENTEYWWGIAKLRKKMAGMAAGDVLESAAGTGRNSEFYDRSKVKSLVMVDKSQGMLDVCKGKWKKMQQEKHGWEKKVGFWVGDLAEDSAILRVDGKGEQFDTVVQTMGLCSTNEPEKLLRNLGMLVKPHGRILLLEHGKGHYEWINKYLDVQAPEHAKRHGCWWNRDIGALVEKSGLEILTMRRYTLGTTWWFELRRPMNFGDVDDEKEVTPRLKNWWEVWK